MPAGILFSKPFLVISAFISSNNSTYLGSIISARDLLDSSLGGLPPTPGTSMLSSSEVNWETEQPCFCFISSACGVGVLKACAISLVTWSPARGITPVWTIDPALKIAISVVPPPISTKQTPKSFSSSERIEYELANCSKTKPLTVKPQFFTHFSMFLRALFEQVTKWTLASSLTPDIPNGSLIPSWSSITYSWGRTWRTSWSDGIETDEAESITFSMSKGFTSLSLMPTMPWELMLLMWLPATPTYIDLIFSSIIDWACSTAFFIASVVASIFTTTPFFSPLEG